MFLDRCCSGINWISFAINTKCGVPGHSALRPTMCFRTKRFDDSFLSLPVLNYIFTVSILIVKNKCSETRKINTKASLLRFCHALRSK